jgi:hypothetical protein
MAEGSGIKFTPSLECLRVFPPTFVTLPTTYDFDKTPYDARYNVAMIRSFEPYTGRGNVSLLDVEGTESIFVMLSAEEIEQRINKAVHETACMLDDIRRRK